ncbi:MAG TPA: TIGR02597 family protein, partial [Opitutus sp.]|nr:TIGR02597 family protein [Opitutus sp.]
TPPVGYQKLAARGASDSHLSVPLVKRSVLTARIDAVGTNTLTLSAEDLVDGIISPGASGSYYVQFVTGDLAGLCLPIFGNTSGILSLESEEDLTSHPLGAIATGHSGDLVRIRPYWNVGDLFGREPASLKLDSVASLPTGPYVGGDAVLLPDNISTGTEKKPAATLYYVFGDGWRQTTNASVDAASEPLPPGQPFIVRRQAVESAALLVVGDVPLEPFRMRIPSLGTGEEIDIAVALAQPFPATLAASGLFSTVEGEGIVNVSTALLESGDLLLEYSSARPGLALPPEHRYHVFGTEWFEVTTPADDHVLNLGEGYVVRLRGERDARYWLQPPTN